MTRKSIVLASALLFAACSTKEQTTQSLGAAQIVTQSVTAERVDGGVRVNNGTSAAIPYVVWDEGFLGLLGPCDRVGKVCPLLGAGKSATVSEGAPGFTGAGNAVVYWWTRDSDPASAPNKVVVGGGR
jgi:hypothetical protein